MDILNRFSGKVIFSVNGADLSGANLYRADLRGADLYGANLYGANLCGAILRGADLRGADLREANLYGANLYGANLCGANLCGADLREADLREANLYGANLYGANLRGANYDANTKGLYQIVPEEGSFIAFKKLANNGIVKLQIPADAGRVGGWVGRKCRAERAIVLEGSGISQHDSSFRYAVGEIVTPDKWDPDPRVECSHGIHFFLTRREAEEY